jgi:hypothetical protein
MQSLLKSKKHYQINNCTFRFGEAILCGIKLKVMQNMVVNNIFRKVEKLLGLETRQQLLKTALLPLLNTAQ